MSAGPGGPGDVEVPYPMVSQHENAATQRAQRQYVHGVLIVGAMAIGLEVFKMLAGFGEGWARRAALIASTVVLVLVALGALLPMAVRSVEPWHDAPTAAQTVQTLGSRRAIGLDRIASRFRRTVLQAPHDDLSSL